MLGTAELGEVEAGYVAHAAIALLGNQVQRYDQVAPLPDVMVCQLHRDGLSLLESILDKCIVLLKAEHESLGHVYEFRYDLLGVLVNVALPLDLFATLSGQEVIDAVTVDHVDRHLDH